MSKYNKTIAALVSAIGVASAALSNGHLGTAELIAVVSAFTGVLAVFGIRNKP